MKTLEERFCAKVEKIPMVECWIWNGATHQFGYGHIRTGKTIEVAHRVAYRLFKNSIPDEMQVLHSCDVPACVNPDHLFLGTQKDNMDDMSSKGRRKSPQMFGEKNPSAKLTESDVAIVRDKINTYKQLNAMFGIGTSQIKRIRRYESWR